MGANSKIPWTDHTFNPWVGCQKVSPGCDHCYAEAWAKRSGLVRWGPKAARRLTSPANWKKPHKWNKAAGKKGVRFRVFCASLADVFDNVVPDPWRARLFRLIRETPNLVWILVTKRIGNASKMLPADWGQGYPNVWLLITVVDQKEVDRDISKLFAVPLAIRGLSIEPQLGKIDLQGIVERLEWIITGAESGPRARHFDEDWARSLRDQCREAGVPFFYKQIIFAGKKIETPFLDDRRWLEFPRAVGSVCETPEAG